ncbi:MAG: hypothetical protein RSB08_01830, partial [Clostridia bacterium]
MTLSKKEKTMILVLILVLIVGGFYVYGITPQNDALEAKETIKLDIQAQIEEEISTGELFSQAKYNNLKRLIDENRQLLADMAAPGLDTNTEVESGNLPDNSSNHMVAYGMLQYLAVRGIKPGDGISIAERTEVGGKVIYNFQTTYVCHSLTELMSFIDDIARHTSYYITNITIGEAVDKDTGAKTVQGVMAI